MWIWIVNRFVNINGGKTQLLLPDICSKNSGVIDLKIDGSVLDEKLSFKMLLLYSSFCLSFLSFCIGNITLCLLLKQPLRKLNLWSVPRSSFFLMLCYISANLPPDLVENTICHFCLVLLQGKCTCWISCRNSYMGLMFLR